MRSSIGGSQKLIPEAIAIPPRTPRAAIPPPPGDHPDRSKRPFREIGGERPGNREQDAGDDEVGGCALERGGDPDGRDEDQRRAQHAHRAACAAAPRRWPRTARQPATPRRVAPNPVAVPLSPGSPPTSLSPFSWLSGVLDPGHSASNRSDDHRRLCPCRTRIGQLCWTLVCGPVARNATFRVSARVTGARSAARKSRVGAGLCERAEHALAGRAAGSG